MRRAQSGEKEDKFHRHNLKEYKFALGVLEVQPKGCTLTSENLFNYKVGPQGQLIACLRYPLPPQSTCQLLFG